MFVFSAAGGHPGPDIPQWAGPSQHWEGRRKGNPGLEREQTQRHRHPRRSPGRQQTSQRAGPQVSQSHSHSARSNRLLRCRGSTNMDLSRDEEGATQDRSNAPITNTNDPEQVRTAIITNPCLIWGLLAGQWNQVLLLLQEENEEEKVWSIEMTARLRENSEISKSRK